MFILCSAIKHADRFGRIYETGCDGLYMNTIPCCSVDHPILYSSYNGREEHSRIFPSNKPKRQLTRPRQISCLCDIPLLQQNIALQGEASKNIECFAGQVDQVLLTGKRLGQHACISTPMRRGTSIARNQSSPLSSPRPYLRTYINDLKIRSCMTALALLQGSRQPRM